MRLHGVGGVSTRVDLAMINSGRWVKVGSKHYRHETGIEMIYRHNDWVWEIRGGEFDGERYERLWPAVWRAVKEAY